METASKPVPALAVEAPQETKAPETKVDSGQEDRIALLAKKESAIRREARKLQEDRKQWEEQLKAAAAPKEAKTESFADWKAKFLADPNSVGVSYEDIQNTFLNQPSKEQQLIMKLQAELESVKGTQAKQFSDIEASQKRAYEQAVKQVSREVKLLVDGNDAYELIRSASENQDAVVKLIESTYKEEGILLSAEEAAKQVEDYLEEQALSIVKLKKIQQKLNPAKPAEEQATEQPSDKQLPTTKSNTLTNAMSASSSTLTEKQRRERAILAFSGKLK